MKRDLLKERRETFAGTLHTTPKYFNSLNETLVGVLNGDFDVGELKTIAKQADKKAEDLISFSEELGFYLFQTYLLDNLESRKTLVEYIKKMPNTTTTKTMKELRNLWQHCNWTIDFSAGMHFFTAQEAIASALSDHGQQDKTNFDKQEQLYEQVFPPRNTADGKQDDLGDIFGSDEFTDRILDEETQNDKDAKLYAELLAIQNRKYTCTSKGYLVHKSYMRGGVEKLEEDVDR